MKRLAIALYCCSVMAVEPMACDEAKCTVDRAMLESMVRDRDSNLEALHIMKQNMLRALQGCQMVNS